MGREQWFSTPKDEISLLEIRSKIEHQGVQREKVLTFSLFFVCIYSCMTFISYLHANIQDFVLK